MGINLSRIAADIRHVTEILRAENDAADIQSEIKVSNKFIVEMRAVVDRANDSCLDRPFTEAHRVLDEICKSTNIRVPTAAEREFFTLGFLSGRCKEQDKIIEELKARIE